MKLIDKDTLVAEIERRQKIHFNDYHIIGNNSPADYGACNALTQILSFIDTLEVIDPYEQCIQYSSIEDGIKAHAETYSFNIESELFNQLTKEQQELWRKEIEQACIGGGEAGYSLAKDTRYKENLEVKDDSLEKFKSLQHISGDLHQTLEDWGYAPNLYYFDGSWHVDWISCEEGDSIKGFTEDTAEEAINKAYNWFHSTFCNG